jgi:hypothetical protein
MVASLTNVKRYNADILPINGDRRRLVAPLTAFADPFELVLVLFDLVAILTAKHLQSEPTA